MTDRFTAAELYGFEGDGDTPVNIRRKALEQAAKIAREGCLVPPDGGSPTEAEVRLCDEIAGRILDAI